MDGTFENLTVLNSPVQAVSVGNNAPLLIRGITIDNSAGDNGDLGHNTDVCLPHLRNLSRDLLLNSHNSKGFDVLANDVTIKNCIVKNQDDCIAINGGSNIIFQDNQCGGGHGISIGSISSGKTVSNVTISGNTVTNSMYGLRIKVQAAATSGSVSRVTYSGNTVSGISKYGVLITQSYPADFGSPGTKTTIRYAKAFRGFESVRQQLIYGYSCLKSILATSTLVATQLVSPSTTKRCVLVWIVATAQANGTGLRSAPPGVLVMRPLCLLMSRYVTFSLLFHSRPREINHLTFWT
jgi:Glycosyl hydrolases family 28